MICRRAPSWNEHSPIARTLRAVRWFETLDARLFLPSCDAVPQFHLQSTRKLDLRALWLARKRGDWSRTVRDRP